MLDNGSDSAVTHCALASTSVFILLEHHGVVRGDFALLGERGEG